MDGPLTVFAAGWFSKLSFLRLLGRRWFRVKFLVRKPTEKNSHMNDSPLWMFPVSFLVALFSHIGWWPNVYKSETMGESCMIKRRTSISVRLWEEGWLQILSAACFFFAPPWINCKKLCCLCVSVSLYLVYPFFGLNLVKKKHTTFGNGSLGSRIDEERSELR